MRAPYFLGIVSLEVGVRGNQSQVENFADLKPAITTENVFKDMKVVMFV